MTAQPRTLPFFAANPALVAQHEDIAARAIARHRAEEAGLPPPVQKQDWPKPSPHKGVAKPPRPRRPPAEARPSRDYEAEILAYLATTSDLWQRAHEIADALPKVGGNRVRLALLALEKRRKVDRGQIRVAGQKANVWRIA